MSLSTRSTGVFTEGVYTGQMTTQLIGGYEGVADITITLTQDSNSEGYDAKVAMDFVKSNCWSIATEKLIFPLKHMEFTAKFVTSDIKDTINGKNESIVMATVSGTATIPFVSQLPNIIQPYMKSEITSSTTVEKDTQGNINAKVSMFGVVTMFGSIKKKDVETQVLDKQKSNNDFYGPNGGGFKPHQDAPAFVSFKQQFHITMMIAIDDCTIENGCLQLVEGGANKREILPQEKDGSISKNIADQYVWTPIECK